MHALVGFRAIVSKDTWGFSATVAGRICAEWCEQVQFRCKPVIFIVVGLLASAAMCIYFIKSTLETSEKTVELKSPKLA